jgi:hypothetical protein
LYSAAPHDEIQEVDRMTRIRLTFLAALIAVAAVATGAAAAAPASSVQFVGGKTTLTTDPATTSVLLQNKIVPLPVSPGTAFPVWKRGLALRYSFPITGGYADPATLAGEIRHSGGIRFSNLANGKSLTVSDFTIDTVAGQLTAAVNGDPAVRVPILDLDLSGADVRIKGRWVNVRGVGASLTATAAGALNASLGVTFFAEGIELGTADVMAKIAGKGGHDDEKQDESDD